MTGARQVPEFFSGFTSLCDALSQGGTAEKVVESHVTPLSSVSVRAQRAVLNKAIETEVIPRLLLAHRRAPAARADRGHNPRVIDGDVIAEFVRLTVEHDTTIAEAFVDALIDQGVSVEHIFTKLFAPAARHLGVLWETDQCTFTDVTIGLSRIQQLVYALGRQFELEEEAAPCSHTVLLVPMPGEHHSLGLLIVEEYFRRAGWNVWAPCNLPEKQLLAAVQRERYDVVGISVTCEVPVARLTTLIATLRKLSLNRSLKIIVGGRSFNEMPALVAAVGADGTDTDGSTAAKWFDSSVERRPAH